MSIFVAFLENTNFTRYSKTKPVKVHVQMMKGFHIVSIKDIDVRNGSGQHTASREETRESSSRSRERDFPPHVFQKTGLHWILKISWDYDV